MSPLPYLPGVQYWNLDTQRFESFVTYNDALIRHRLRPMGEKIDEMLRHFGGDRPWLLLKSPLKGAANYGYELDYRVIGVVLTDERYYLYRPRIR